MCDNPLNKGKGLRTDSLLGREECKSPFGSYELKIPKDNKMECTADGFTTNTNCKDLDVSNNARCRFASPAPPKKQINNNKKHTHIPLPSRSLLRNKGFGLCRILNLLEFLVSSPGFLLLILWDMTLLATF